MKTLARNRINASSFHTVSHIGTIDIHDFKDTK